MTLKISFAIAALSASSSAALALTDGVQLPLTTTAETTILITEDQPAHGELHSPLLDSLPAAAEVGSNPPEVENTRLADGLVFPLMQNPDTRAFAQFSFGFYVDNDSRFPNQTRDYSGAGWTYDLDDGYNHAGSDFVLAPFPWHQMDNEQPAVVAALGGVIEALADENFDRQCQWVTPLPPVNGLRIRHDDGTLAIYLHMRQGSLGHLSEGDRVAQGDYLGQAASSGFSLIPHLHFELRDSDLNILDPFAGVGSQANSHWRHQPDYLQTDVLRIATHAAPPVLFQDSCLESVTNFQDVFQPGQRIYSGVAIRHQPLAQLSPTIIGYMPDGTEAYRETITSPGSGRPQLVNHVVSADLPAFAPAGTWQLRVLYNSRVYHGHFFVGGRPPSTQVHTAILPSSRSVVASNPATAFLTAVNGGQEDAMACHIRPDAPFDGTFSFQETDSITNAPVGQPDFAIGIPAGESRSFVIAATPSAGSEARNFDLPVIVQCANSPSNTRILGVNSLRLSFSATASPDLIAIGRTTSGDGILTLDGPGSAAAFAIATANVGVGGELTIHPSASFNGDLTIEICETDFATGTCITSRAASVTSNFNANETASFAVFIRSQTGIPFDPAGHRIRFDAVDLNGVSRGSTSVAIRTGQL